MKTTSPTYVLTFMLVICVVFGSGIAYVNYLMQPMLLKNEALFKNRALAKAFQLPVEGQSSQAYEKTIVASLISDSISINGKNTELYTSLVDSSVGFVFSGIGFWDAIVGIVVLKADLTQIKNLQFLKQSETPGLGARIEERWFTDQFNNLTVDWQNSEKELVIIGASPKPNLTNRVDGITGATQTTIALMKTMNIALGAFKAAYLQRKHTNG
ncbi:MAG: FMN-binding protein [Chitinivibrionales bacterium]|nr:FMN-binding protein [Chitinivibrionales bacterium]